MSFFNPAWHLIKGKKAAQTAFDIANLRSSQAYEDKIAVCEEKLVVTEIFQMNAANKTKNEELVVEEKDSSVDRKSSSSQHQEILWLNVFFITLFHMIGVYALVVEVWRTKLPSIIWAMVVGGIGGFGITAGVHRLWAHRSYKAKLPLQLILLFCYTVAGQNDVREWVRDHRVHHRFSETDADPHNSNRGVFFAHVGWLMQKKHPDVTIKGKTVDMSDIYSDPLITFHTRYFLYFKILFCFLIPTIIPVYCWNESWRIAILSQMFARYVINLNFTWSVNSIAHTWGNKPYDKNIKPTENLAVAVMAMGEGFHNYHHVFPWDYKAAELGNYSFNVTTFWLDLFAKIGWAYDLRTPSKQLIQRVITKRGNTSTTTEVEQ